MKHNLKQHSLARRILAAVLMLCLFIPAAALAGSNEYDSLADAIKAYLNSQDYKYDYDSTKDRFSYNMSLDSKIRECDVSIFVHDDGFNVYAYSPISPKPSDSASMAEVAEFITRANYTLNLGSFEMDYSDGELRYKTSIKCFDSIPSQKEIEWLVDIPTYMVEKFGDGLAMVILMGTDAEEAFAPYAEE